MGLPPWKDGARFSLVERPGSAPGLSRGLAHLAALSGLREPGLVHLPGQVSLSNSGDDNDHSTGVIDKDSLAAFAEGYQVGINPPLAYNVVAERNPNGKTSNLDILSRTGISAFRQQFPTGEINQYHTIPSMTATIKAVTINAFNLR